MKKGFPKLKSDTSKGISGLAARQTPNLPARPSGLRCGHAPGGQHWLNTQRSCRNPGPAGLWSTRHHRIQGPVSFRRGGDILYTVTTEDNGYWGLGVSLKYLFRAGRL